MPLGWEKPFVSRKYFVNWSLLNRYGAKIHIQITILKDPVFQNKWPISYLHFRRPHPICGIATSPGYLPLPLHTNPELKYSCSLLWIYLRGKGRRVGTRGRPRLSCCPQCWAGWCSSELFQLLGRVCRCSRAPLSAPCSRRCSKFTCGHRCCQYWRATARVSWETTASLLPGLGSYCPQWCWRGPNRPIASLLSCDDLVPSPATQERYGLLTRLYGPLCLLKCCPVSESKGWAAPSQPTTDAWLFEESLRFIRPLVFYFCSSPSGRKWPNSSRPLSPCRWASPGQWHGRAQG